MKQDVLLGIVSIQRFQEEEPEITRFMTQGTLEVTEQGIRISYEETELTGLQGTVTTFFIEGNRVTLRRTGAVESCMVFSVGEMHQSLYDMGMGALMITVRTEALENTITSEGGTVQVRYGISIEEETAGVIEYRIDVTPK